MPDQRQYAGYSINELPKVNTDDEGKVLAVVKGKWDKSGSQIELPVVSSDDNGKVLGVTEGTWNKMDAPTELPAVTNEDNGRILQVSNGSWTKQNMPTELPAVTAGDNGKVLGVVEGNWGLTGVPDANSFIICTEYDSQNDEYITNITRDDIVEALRNNRSVYLYHVGDRHIYQFIGINCSGDPSSATITSFSYPAFAWFGTLSTGIEARIIKLNKLADKIDSYSDVDIDSSRYETSDIGKIIRVGATGYQVPDTNRFIIEATSAAQSNTWDINKTWTQIKNAWAMGYNIYLGMPLDRTPTVENRAAIPLSRMVPDLATYEQDPDYNEPKAFYFQCFGRYGDNMYKYNIYIFKIGKPSSGDNPKLALFDTITIPSST